MPSWICPRSRATCVQNNLGRSSFAGSTPAISAGRDGPLVNIRLVRLKKDSIDKIDVKRLKEEILAYQGENRYLRRHRRPRPRSDRGTRDRRISTGGSARPR